MGKITVTGSSIINHNARHKLGVSVNEYVLLQFFADHYTDGMVFSEHSCMSMLGLDHAVVEYGKNSLILKGLLLPTIKKDLYQPYKEWYDTHKEKGYEFGLFWQPVVVEDETISWRNSSKEGTKRKFAQVMKEAPIEQLVYSKIRYFIMKYESKSLDYIMGSEPFIGPDKHYKIHWKLKPDGEDLLLDVCRKYYWKGMQLDLSSFFMAAVDNVPSGPAKIDFND